MPEICEHLKAPDDAPARTPGPSKLRDIGSTPYGPHVQVSS